MSVFENVKARLTTSGGDLARAIEDHFVKIEIEKRAGVLIDAITKANEIKGLIAKVRPDNVQYDADGNKTVESYSKKRIDEKTAMIKALDKLEKAINKILNEGGNDIEGLKKLSTWKPGGKPEADDATEDGDANS